MEEKEIKPVCVEAVADELQMVSEYWTVFYNKVTGEFAARSDDHDELSKEERKAIDQGEDYIMLPDSYDIHEWSIMERFAYGLPEGEAQDVILHALHGSGAFRNFRFHATRFGLMDDYYKYKDKAFLEIAREWCEDNEIPYFHREKK